MLGARMDPRPAGAAVVQGPDDAVAAVSGVLAGADREHCVVVALDTKHRVLGVRTVSVGTADRTFMAPREVFRDALDMGAAAVVVAHNHPSGDPTPSADDRAVTRRLAAAGELLGVPLLDHVVVGAMGWVSLAREGELAWRPRQ